MSTNHPIPQYPLTLHSLSLGTCGIEGLTDSQNPTPPPAAHLQPATEPRRLGLGLSSPTHLRLAFLKCTTPHRHHLMRTTHHLPYSPSPTISNGTPETEPPAAPFRVFGHKSLTFARRLFEHSHPIKVRAPRTMHSPKPSHGESVSDFRPQPTLPLALLNAPSHRRHHLICTTPLPLPITDHHFFRRRVRN